MRKLACAWSASAWLSIRSFRPLESMKESLRGRERAATVPPAAGAPRAGAERCECRAGRWRDHHGIAAMFRSDGQRPGRDTKERTPMRRLGPWGLAGSVPALEAPERALRFVELLAVLHHVLDVAAVLRFGHEAL